MNRHQRMGYLTVGVLECAQFTFLNRSMTPVFP